MREEEASVDPFLGVLPMVLNCSHHGGLLPWAKETQHPDLSIGP